MKPLGMLTFYALTPLHMGAGSSLSYVDLPIQREKHTGFPVLWASGIKGAMREWFERNGETGVNVDKVFGPKPKVGESKDLEASYISITDGRLLLYPVRSGKGVFAWITCPLVLRRFIEDLEVIEANDLNSIKLSFGEIMKKLNDKELLFFEISEVLIDDGRVILEEFQFNKIEKISQLPSNLKSNLKEALPEPMNEELERHLVIVHDDLFRDLVTYTTEVRTRIRIDQTTGTVDEGALFTEEFVPSEALFYSLLFWGERRSNQGRRGKDEESKKEDGQGLEEQQESFVGALRAKLNYLFLGGDETIGKGLVKVSLLFPRKGGDGNDSQESN